jgi:GNAT superfamily N-acetyltransferase
VAARSPALVAPPGYTIRQPDLADAHDREQLIAITRLVFGVTFDGSAIDLEERMLTHREYVVAETVDGTFAAWCGIWAVPEIGAGQFEPVGTHPDHRRRGLASLVMSRGLDWMRQRGLEVAFVGTGVRNASNQLYASLGFEVAELYQQWEWLPPRAEPG